MNIDALPGRFQAKIRIDDVEFQGQPCWRWTGASGPNGYGRVYFLGKLAGSHRAVYQILVGEIPAGLQLDHLCRRRYCVNPLHLEPVTLRENVRRGKSAEFPTFCRRGHEMAVTARHGVRPDGRPRRYCYTCRLLKQAERTAASA